ncbi:hypothetical protein A2697_01570 [Candidatus Curtissbacteria bacterium RIFCSPHIGHO2_01_FULL_41_44]|uniref:Glycosyltransferase RgtA/B/C/D-like domain-containing protein n=1 Tax=Candidatus Curtissbacteria bacterium RIFCSPLOWO2_01_FULL_42_50 TaxID=1797730 RepID=A0A1F5H6D4_9BACT|nr:MAG: hypothetical protein A2697_01570 [Candidatus Curtissbacteria bacterium RIFCSPHIGHO2_01_FULL_41_44]OGD99619.1 MAG: hypothetical protein A3B54_02945 [Candidatus Curtissbacteria bacterium RIFCSPLOWO2_01_FULL_42_50]
MKLIKKNIFLILIIFLAVILRFINLSSIPIGFNDDEAAFGYNAYSILKTGRDEWGRLLPFPVFESFGDWKLVGYLYLAVISQAILGVNEFATRLPSAIFGVLAVWATYLLTKELFRNFNLKLKIGNWKLEIAHVAAFFLAISPWHIIASRNAFESDILIFIISLSTYFFLLSLKIKKFIIFAFLGLVSAFYIYRSSWLFVPLFVLNLLYLHRERLKNFKTDLKKTILLSFVLLLPLIPVVTTFKGQARFFQESFIAGVQKSGIIDEVNEKLGACQDKWPNFFCKLIYNRYDSYFTRYINNYFSNLSPELFYLRGVSGGYQAFSIRSLFYSFELPLLIIGLFFLISKKPYQAKILIPWILLVPLGASITGVGNPGRLNILIPTTQIIAAFGYFSIYNLIKSQKVANLILIISAIFIVSVVARLVVDMFSYYPLVSGRYQRYGYKPLFDYLESQKPKYNQIAVSRKNDDAKQYIHYLFFEQYDPKAYQESVLRYVDQRGWQVVEQVGNFRFYPSTPGLENLPPKTLLAVGEKEVVFPIGPIFVVNYKNGDRVFEVYDVDMVKEKMKEKYEQK